MKKQNLSQNFSLRRNARGKFSRGLNNRLNIISSSQERGRARGRSSGLGQIKHRLGESVGRGNRGRVIRDRGGKVINGEKKRGIGRGRGLEFGGRSVILEDDDDDDDDDVVFDNLNQGNIGFGINENLQLTPSVQFMGNEQPVIIIEDTNENLSTDFREPFEEEGKILDRRSKESIERDLLKLDRERVEDLMYEEELKRFEKERKTVEQERKELDNLRKTIEEEKRKVQMLKRQAEEEEERERSRSMGRDLRKNYNERFNDDSDSDGERDKNKDLRLLSSKGNIGLNREDNKRPLLQTSSDGYRPSSSRMTAAFIKRPTSSDKYHQTTRSPSVDKYHQLANRSPSVDKYRHLSNRSPSMDKYRPSSSKSPPRPSSNRMTAAGFLQLLNKHSRPREDDRRPSDMPRKEKLDLNKRESRHSPYNDRPNKERLDIMKGPTRSNFNDSTRGSDYDGGFRPENNGSNFGLNQGTNHSRYNEFSRDFGHSKEPRTERFESGARYEANRFHDASREGGFSESSQGGSGFQDGSGRAHSYQMEGELNKSLQRGTGFSDSRKRFLNEGEGGYNEYSRSQSSQKEGRFEDISRGANPNQRGSEFAGEQLSGGGFVDASRGLGAGFVESSKGFPSNKVWGAYKNSSVGVGLGSNAAGGGYNNDSSRGFGSNANMYSSSSGHGLYQDHNRGGMGSISGGGQFSQLHQGNFSTGIQNVDTNRNPREREEMYESSGMFNTFSGSSTRDERGFRQDSIGGESCAVSSRSFREDEYHFRGGECSNNNFSTTTGFSAPFGNESRYETSGRPTQSERWNPSLPSEFSSNKYKKTGETPKPFPPPPFQGKRTDDERVQRMLQRKKKKLRIAQSRLRPNQYIMKDKIEKQIEEIEVSLRKVSERCYEQRQIAKILRND